MTIEQRSARGRAARPWRALLIIYVAGLTAGTHWPRLVFVGPTFPQPDKLLHILAFAGLMVILWRTRWIHSLPLAAAAAVMWAIIDEVTQGLPGLGREVSAQDTLAGVVGIAIATAWIAALGPVGGPLNRARPARLDEAFDDVFLQRRAWLMLALAFAAGAGGSWLAIWLLWEQLLKYIAIDRLMRMSFFVMAGCGGLATWAVLRPLWRRSIEALIAREGEAASRGHILPDRAAVPVALNLAMALVVIAIVTVIVVNPGVVADLLALERWIGPLAPTTPLALDLGVLGITLATLVRLRRSLLVGAEHSAIPPSVRR